MRKVESLLSSIQQKLFSLVTIINEEFFCSLLSRRNRMIDYSFYITSPRIDLQLGEIYDVDLGIGIGSELQKTRPCIIISNNAFNKGDTVSILPITSLEGYKKIGIISIKVVKSKMNGLDNDSIILISKIREISKKRLKNKRGNIEGKYLKECAKSIGFYFGIKENHP